MANSANLGIIDFSPYQIASQLTLRDLCQFKAIDTTEYENYFDKLPDCENLNKFVQTSNEEMHWVIYEISNEPNVVRQAKIIKKFIQIAQIGKECRNYNLVFAIVSGLGYSSVKRLDEAWSKVNNKHKKIFKVNSIYLFSSINWFNLFCYS